MQLNIKAMSLAFGLIWSFGILFMAAANMIWPGYGHAFLEMCASIYPGYRPGTGIGSVAIGTIYGFVDGAVGAAVFTWLYNFFARVSLNRIRRHETAHRCVTIAAGAFHRRRASEFQRLWLRHRDCLRPA